MTLLQKIHTDPTSIAFSEVIEFVDAAYDFTPTRFTNGLTPNEANQNNGSCKIFSVAKLLGLNQEQTLSLFGDYYRVDVLQHPDGSDHANIRSFMVTGWEGLKFEGDALQFKNR